jgi:transcriptional regulator with XRE-family HTH domain
MTARSDEPGPRDWKDDAYKFFNCRIAPQYRLKEGPTMAERKSDAAVRSAEVVEYILGERKLSQEELAEILEVSASFISRVRAGKRAFTLDHLQAIEERLGMPLGAVLLATMKKLPRDRKLAKARELAVMALKSGDRAAKAIRAARAEAAAM